MSRILLLLLPAVVLAACRPVGSSSGPIYPASPPPSQVAPHETPIPSISPVAPHVEPSRPPETPIATLGDDS